MTNHAVLDLLDLAAEPGTVAIVDGSSTLTRGELLARAEARAADICAVVPPDCRVALADTQDAEAIVNILAAFLAGRSVAMVPQESGLEPEDAARRRCAAILRSDGLDKVDLGPDEDPALDARAGVDATGSPESVLLFTSGTTREPRGVRLSQRNVASNLTAMLRWTPSWAPSDRFGMVLALTHSFGLSMVLLSLARRVPIVMLGGGLPSRRLADRFDENEVSVLACVPYYLRLLRRRGMGLCEDFGHTLHTLYLAGGGVTDDELDALLPRFEGSRFHMYGFTESTARVAVRRPGDGAPPNSVGLPLPGTNVEIVSSDGVGLPVGEEGRIRVCSPSLMMGYLGDPLRPPGSPFTTTDLGRVDAAGNLFVTGRQAEMLNFRGNRVSVVSVEATVVGIEGVLDARLVPDVRDEDAQCTLFVIAGPEADHGVVRREALRVVAPRGILREVVFTDHLETTRSGKPLRRS